LGGFELNQNPLVAVVGPTASGKTKFAIELARNFFGEIVCADSMQIYKELSISTAKPTEAEQKAVPHHLFDIISVRDSYSVAQYAEVAKRTIDEIISRDALPILTGGTGLYIDSVLNNVKFSDDPVDLSLRARLQAEYDELGGEYMLKKMKEFDKTTANSLHPNNNKRIIRAFEIYLSTGKSMSEQIKESKRETSPYKTLIFGLSFKNRDKLYERINQRVDDMVKNGIVDEAKMLYQTANGSTAAQAIGCKEFFPYINGQDSLDSCIENLKQQTRRYAKRQLTWFRRNKNINWFYLDETDFEDAVKSAEEKIKIFLERG
jgi:tRNA dimethylallyltransferase